MAGVLGAAQPYVTGPVPIWISAVGSGVPLFLGHAERTPRVQFRPRYSQLFVDLGGQEVPFDLVKQGTDAIISADLTRFSEDVYELLQVAGSHEGAVFGDYGTLMMSENETYELWLPFPYTVIHPAMADQRPGFHFLSVICMNDDIDSMGTVPRRQRLIWHAIRKFDPTTYDFTISNEDFSAIPGGIGAIPSGAGGTGG